MVDFKHLAANLIRGNAHDVKNMVKEAIDGGESAARILQEGLFAGMSVVGDRFKKNECYIPEVLMSARAMKEGMELLRPLLNEKDLQSEGTVVLGTVKGDLHDIGKNLVGMMLEGAGFEVIDLGIDVPAERFIEKAKENDAPLIGLSCLLTTTMPAVHEVIASLDRSRSDRTLKVMIGGAPVTREYADEIGADGYAPDAAHAVDVAKKLVCGL